MSANWEDLRYILAIERAGTILEAAKSLGVSPSTMSRRVRSLERDYGTALFDKYKHGAVLSGAGHRVVQVATEVERLTDELDAEIQGLDHKLAGTLRVTSTETLLRHFLQDIAAFQKRFADIQLELTAAVSIANLTQREADVAVRIAPRAPDHLIGRKHAAFSFAVFAGAPLADALGTSAGYQAYPWLSWDPSVNRSTDVWINKNAPGARVVTRVAGMPVMEKAVELGLGITVLPCFIGDANPRLVRVGDYLAEQGVFLWVLTHPQLRGTARIRAFVNTMSDLIDRDRDLIEGRRPQPTRAKTVAAESSTDASPR